MWGRSGFIDLTPSQPCQGALGVGEIISKRGFTMRETAIAAGIVLPEHLELLGEVFEATKVSGETLRQREARASRILSYFQLGIIDKNELCTLARQPLGR